MTALEIIKFHVKFGEQETDPDDLLEDALRFAGRLAEDKGIRLAVMIDEFQELLKWGRAFEDVQERHAVTAGRILCPVRFGAHHHAGTGVRLGISAVPPAGGDTMNKLPDEDTAKFVGERLASAGIRRTAACRNNVFEMSRGYPTMSRGLDCTSLCAASGSTVNRSPEAM